MKAKEKPCVLFLIPPANERLNEYFDEFDAAGFQVCIVRYGSGSKGSWKEELDWIKAECHNLKAIIRPDDLCFCDAWAIDEFNKTTYRISNLIAKLKKQGAVDFKASFSWGGPFDDAVVMYGTPAADFVKSVLNVAGMTHGGFKDEVQF